MQRVLAEVNVAVDKELRREALVELNNLLDNWKILTSSNSVICS